MLNKVINLSYPIVMVAALVCLCWTSSNMVWLLINDNQDDSLPQKVSHQIVSIQSKNTTSISVVNQLNLFGRPNLVKAVPSSVKKSKLADINAPETKLNLKLMGLRHGTGKIKSSAIIEGPDKKQHIYYKGDKLPSGNAVVEEIYMQHMIISRQGKYETLTLFTLLKNNKSYQKIKTESSNNKYIDLTHNHFVTEKFIQYKDIALNDPVALDGLIQAQTVLVGNKIRGYKLSAGYDHPFFEAAGLKPGDIVTSVNNIGFDKESSLMELIDILSNASDVNIKIERGGQAMTFRYNLK